LHWYAITGFVSHYCTCCPASLQSTQDSNSTGHRKCPQRDIMRFQVPPPWVIRFVHAWGNSKSSITPRIPLYLVRNTFHSWRYEILERQRCLSVASKRHLTWIFLQWVFDSDMKWLRFPEEIVQLPNHWQKIIGPCSQRCHFQWCHYIRDQCDMWLLELHYYHWSKFLAKDE
jgi:hypothetical protein